MRRGSRKGHLSVSQSVVGNPCLYGVGQLLRKSALVDSIPIIVWFVDGVSKAGPRDSTFGELCLRAFTLRISVGNGLIKGLAPEVIRRASWLEAWDSR